MCHPPNETNCFLNSSYAELSEHDHHHHLKLWSLPNLYPHIASFSWATLPTGHIHGKWMTKHTTNLIWFTDITPDLLKVVCFQRIQILTMTTLVHTMHLTWRFMVVLYAVKGSYRHVVSTLVKINETPKAKPTSEQYHRFFIVFTYTNAIYANIRI